MFSFFVIKICVFVISYVCQFFSDFGDVPFEAMFLVCIFSYIMRSAWYFRIILFLGILILIAWYGISWWESEQWIWESDTWTIDLIHDHLVSVAPPLSSSGSDTSNQNPDISELGEEKPWPKSDFDEASWGSDILSSWAFSWAMSTWIIHNQEIFSDLDQEIISWAYEKVWTWDQEEYQEALSWSQETGIISVWPELIITEVYFDGTDEWIEITNRGWEAFVGKCTLSGAKSSPLTVTTHIPAGASYLFWDQLNQVHMISGIVGKTGLSLNFIDTSAIDVSIRISGMLVDKFLVDEYRVKKYNDKKTAFERVGDVITPVVSERAVNASWVYLINPGVYFLTGNYIQDVSFAPGSFAIPIDCTSLSSDPILRVSEVFFWNTRYPPYVELDIIKDTSGEVLSLSGNLLAVPFDIWTNTQGIVLEKWQKILISSTGFWQELEHLTWWYDDNFSLVSTWNFLVITFGYRQSWQVMDIVYISWYSPDTSLYFNQSTYQCVRIFDEKNMFSPAFDKYFLKYLPTKTIKEIEYIASSTTTTWCLPDADPSLSYSGEKIAFTSGLLDQYDIRIVDIVYDPPGSDTHNEQITLFATHRDGDTTPLDMKWFKLVVNGNNKTLSGILLMNTPTIFTKTFGFPNTSSWSTPVIIQLTYQGYVFDTYTYIPTSWLNKKDQETLTSTGYYVSSVIDGDSFRIKYQGKTQTVRLLGVDAPESTLTRFRHLQCFGKEATTYLKQLIDKQRIRLEFDPTQPQTDMYDRLLAYVYKDDILINQRMIQDWYAKEYTYKTAYQFQELFRDAQRRAEENHLWLRSPDTCGMSMSDIQRSGDSLSWPSLILSWAHFLITYVLPNPKGKDTHEELWLLITWTIFVWSWQDKQTLTAIQTIDMFPDFFLRIGKTTTPLASKVSLNQEHIFSGALGLVNKASCVELWYQETLLTYFCYPQPKEGQKIFSSASEFFDLPDTSLSILNDLRLKRFGNDMCTVYKDTQIVCKRIPMSKAEKHITQQKQLYQTFSTLLKNYLLTNRKDLYYQTEIAGYYALLKYNTNVIKKGESRLYIYGKPLATTNIKYQRQHITQTRPSIRALYEGYYALTHQASIFAMTTSSTYSSK